MIWLIRAESISSKLSQEYVIRVKIVLLITCKNNLIFRGQNRKKWSFLAYSRENQKTTAVIFFAMFFKSYV